MNKLDFFSNPLITLLQSIGVSPDISLFGNTVLEYAQAIVVFVLLLAIFKIFQFIVLVHLKKLAEKTTTDIDDTVIDVFKSMKPPFYSFLAFYLAFQFLALNDIADNVINILLIIWVFYQIIIGVQVLINSIVERRLSKDGDEAARGAFSLIGKLAKGILWGFGILMVLSNLGINVSSLIAGLGIGGIAIAFALQNILSDIFSSFAIYFDKPFKIGDFIIVGEHLGVVEKIGIKTTRIRALQGEEIAISNQELTSARVQNFKKMEERRIVFSFGITYQTPVEKVKKIPNTVRDIISKIDQARTDRVHFQSFGDSALVFEVVYYVTVSDYAVYMDIQQEINLKLMLAFEDEQIEFAYPTQTIYMAKG